MELKEGPIERKTKVLQRNAHNTHIRQEHVTKRMIWVRLSPKANNGNETNSFTFDGLPKDKTSKTKNKK